MEPSFRTRHEDYAYRRPSLVAQKLRALDLAAGAPSRRGQRGSSYAHNLKQVHARERALSQQAELAYVELTESWRKRRSGKRAGAATGERL